MKRMSFFNGKRRIRHSSRIQADFPARSRRLNELEINAMVSVFLRQLEYYRGILFLTTNRVGDIDPAFKSRIHVSLEYEPLDRRRTKKIYKLHLRRIKEALEMRRNSHGSNFKVNSEEILVWSDQHFKSASKRHRQWNGRYVPTSQALILFNLILD